MSGPTPPDSGWYSQYVPQREYVNRPFVQHSSMAGPSRWRQVDDDFSRHDLQLPPLRMTQSRPTSSASRCDSVSSPTSRPSKAIAIADLLAPAPSQHASPSELSISSAASPDNASAGAHDSRLSPANHDHAHCRNVPCYCHFNPSSSAFRRHQQSLTHTVQSIPPSTLPRQLPSPKQDRPVSQTGGVSAMSVISSPRSWVTSSDASMSPQVLPAASAASPIPPLHDYSLSFRQQPEAARACGHGDRDRRVVDPPPIVQLKITERATGNPVQDHSAIFALHCTLLDAETGAEVIHPGYDQSAVANMGAMMGTLVVSPFQGKDEYGIAGTFFIFSDLSCRFPGRYILKYELLRINLQSFQPGTVHGTVATIRSEPFITYPAKDFPGMKASTALLRALRRQGLNVGIKKGSEARKLLKDKQRRRSSSAESSDDGLQKSRAGQGRAQNDAVIQKAGASRPKKKARAVRTENRSFGMV